jgi:hypothetical protein
MRLIVVASRYGPRQDTFTGGADHTLRLPLDHLAQTKVRPTAEWLRGKLTVHLRRVVPASRYTPR